MQLLWLIQLSDSALPIGGMSHSFGIETLVAEGLLNVEQLESFLRDYLTEAGLLESAFCRAAYRLATASQGALFIPDWLGLNNRLSAYKLARESREGTARLARRFLRLVCELSGHSLLDEALDSAAREGVNIYHCAAFGLAGGALRLDEESTVLAYGHQTLANLVSACQRLMPLGQTQASRILWNLKPTLFEVAKRSRTGASALEEIDCCVSLLELGSMRHPSLATRLFIS